MIPKELQERKQWICWKYEQRPDRPKPTKIPYNPVTGFKASTMDPSTWTDFQTAAAQAGKYSGIGFVFTKNDPYVGIDLDHVLDDKGEFIFPDAKELFEKCNSYTEVSPSGTGIHILGKAKLHDMAHKVEENTAIGTCEKELYESGRYFTVTGHQLGNVSEIKDVQNVTDELEQVMAKAQKSKKKAPAKTMESASTTSRNGPVNSNEEDPVITYARTVFPEINTAAPGQGNVLHDKAVHIAQFLQEGEIIKAVKDQDLFITYKQKGMLRTTVVPDQGLGFNIPSDPEGQRTYLYGKLFRHLDRTQTWDITKRPKVENLHKVTQLLVADMQDFPGGGGTRKCFDLSIVGQKLGKTDKELVSEIQADTAQMPALNRTFAVCQKEGKSYLLVAKEIIGAFSYGKELEKSHIEAVSKEEAKSNDKVVQQEDFKPMVADTLVSTHMNASFLWLQKQKLPCKVMEESEMSHTNFKNCSFQGIEIKEGLKDSTFMSCNLDNVKVDENAKLEDVKLTMCRFGSEADVKALEDRGASIESCSVYKLNPETQKQEWQVIGVAKPKFIENKKAVPERQSSGGMER